MRIDLYCFPSKLKRQPSRYQNFEAHSHSLFSRCLRLATTITGNHPRLATGGWLDLTRQAFHLLDYSPLSGRTIPIYLLHFIIFYPKTLFLDCQKAAFRLPSLLTYTRSLSTQFSPHMPLYYNSFLRVQKNPESLSASGVFLRLNTECTPDTHLYTICALYSQCTTSIPLRFISVEAFVS